jgi:hypothetical protein
LNKEELVDAIVSRSDLKKSEARKAADAVFESLAAALKGGNDVSGRDRIRAETNELNIRELATPAPQDALPEGRWTAETPAEEAAARIPIEPFSDDYQLLEEAAEEFRSAAERLLAVADEALAEARKGKDETRAILDRIERRLAQHGAE